MAAPPFFQFFGMSLVSMIHPDDLGLPSCFISRFRRSECMFFRRVPISSQPPAGEIWKNSSTLIPKVRPLGNTLFSLYHKVHRQSRKNANRISDLQSSSSQLFPCRRRGMKQTSLWTDGCQLILKNAKSTVAFMGTNAYNTGIRHRGGETWKKSWDFIFSAPSGAEKGID